MGSKTLFGFPMTQTMFDPPSASDFPPARRRLAPCAILPWKQVEIPPFKQTQRTLYEQNGGPAALSKKRTYITYTYMHVFEVYKLFGHLSLKTMKCKG